jgi:hypothetical protein
MSAHIQIDDPDNIRLAADCLAQIERLHDLGNFADARVLAREGQLVHIRMALHQYAKIVLERIEAKS